MKILIVLKGYFPAIHYGGPPVSISNFCSLLKDTFEFFIIANDHEKGSSIRFKNISDGWNTRSEAKVKYLKEKELNYKCFNNIIDEVQPDIVYLNSLFNAQTTIPFLWLCKQKHIPCLLATRGELCLNALNLKKFKKIPYIFMINKLFISPYIYLQATSYEEMLQIQKLIDVEPKKVVFLDNIPTLPSKEITKSAKEKGKLRCVFISRIHRKKNILYAIKVLSKLNGDIVYDIYGYIEDVEYWNSILKQIEKLPNNIKVNYCGTLDRESVHQAFAKYDVFLFPTLSENYGQAIVESMLSQCPVVISDQTPWNDVNTAKAGWAIPLEKESTFVEVLQDLVDMDNEDYMDLLDKNNNYIASKLDLQKIKTDYISVLQKIRLNGGI